MRVIPDKFSLPIYVKLTAFLVVGESMTAKFQGPFAITSDLAKYI